VIVPKVIEAVSPGAAILAGTRIKASIDRFDDTFAKRYREKSIRDRSFTLRRAFRLLFPREPLQAIMLPEWTYSRREDIDSPGLWLRLGLIRIYAILLPETWISRSPMHRKT